MVETPTQNNLPRPNHGSEKSDWLGQTNKQTLTIFNDPILDAYNPFFQKREQFMTLNSWTEKTIQT
jgi:hypothetical protein